MRSHIHHVAAAAAQHENTMNGQVQSVSPNATILYWIIDQDYHHVALGGTVAAKRNICEEYTRAQTRAQQARRPGPDRLRAGVFLVGNGVLSAHGTAAASNQQQQQLKQAAYYRETTRERCALARAVMNITIVNCAHRFRRVCACMRNNIANQHKHKHTLATTIQTPSRLEQMLATTTTTHTTVVLSHNRISLKMVCARARCTRIWPARGETLLFCCCSSSTIVLQSRVYFHNQTLIDHTHTQKHTEMVCALFSLRMLCDVRCAMPPERFRSGVSERGLSSAQMFMYVGTRQVRVFGVWPLFYATTPLN